MYLYIGSSCVRFRKDPTKKEIEIEPRGVTWLWENFWRGTEEFPQLPFLAV
jgi:hypothetical protein